MLHRCLLSESYETQVTLHLRCVQLYWPRPYVVSGMSNSCVRNVRQLCQDPMLCQECPTVVSGMSDSCASPWTELLGYESHFQRSN
jgi:hypothetical protein